MRCVLLLLLLLLCPAMNEMTWRKVQDWEQLRCQECKYPTLLKFQGKPHDLRCARSSSSSSCGDMTCLYRR
jgi:hypothetical protein